MLKEKKELEALKKKKDEMKAEHRANKRAFRDIGQTGVKRMNQTDGKTTLSRAMEA